MAEQMSRAEAAALFGEPPPGPRQAPLAFPQTAGNGWTGWMRLKHQQWKPMCQADTWGACWTLLFRERPVAFCEKWVRRSGLNPNVA